MENETIVKRKKKPFLESHVMYNLNIKEPVAGDVVYVSSSNNKHIKKEMIGIIEGQIGEAKDEYTICFDPIFPVKVLGDSLVICDSGYRILVKASNIRFNGNIKMLFKREGIHKNDTLDLVKRFYVTVKD